MTISTLISTLPKADLHLHLVGSASPSTVLNLARRHPDAGVPANTDDLARFYRFTDFAHFIDVYYAVNRLIREPEDVTTLVAGAARDAAASNVRWAEITVTAHSHLSAGIPGTALHDALEAGRATAHTDHGVDIGWIIDIPGEFGLAAADVTVAFLQDHAPAGTVAIGLAGVEQGVPRAQFAGHIDQARDLGYRAAIHAGESTGPESIWSALNDLKADRIGHGIRAVDDPDLLAHLAHTQTPLEVCVTSNLCTNVVNDLARHPVADLLAAGVNVTLATDDPGMFGTDLNSEYQRVADITGYEEAGLTTLARAAVEASFAPQPLQDSIMAEINSLSASA